ncbi:MAG: hypothetical protein ABI603_09335 [Acidobacteriota bacterium]
MPSGSARTSRHLRFFFDAPGGAALPEALAADYLWTPKALPAAQRLGSGGWAVAFEGARSVVFARTPAGSVPALPLSADPGCFP